MKYFEFNNHEYWAMVAGEDTEKAIGVYTEEVAGEGIEQVKEEGEPTEITRDQALKRYIEASMPLTGQTIEKIIEEFNDRENTTLLIESSLA